MVVGWEVRLIVHLDRHVVGDSIGTFRTREEAEQAAGRQSLMCSIKKVRVQGPPGRGGPAEEDRRAQQATLGAQRRSGPAVTKNDECCAELWGRGGLKAGGIASAAVRTRSEIHSRGV